MPLASLHFCMPPTGAQLGGQPLPCPSLLMVMCRSMRGVLLAAWVLLAATGAQGRCVGSQVLDLLRGRIWLQCLPAQQTPALLSAPAMRRFLAPANAPLPSPAAAAKECLCCALHMQRTLPARSVPLKPWAWCGRVVVGEQGRQTPLPASLRGAHVTAVALCFALRPGARLHASYCHATAQAPTTMHLHKHSMPCNCTCTPHTLQGFEQDPMLASIGMAPQTRRSLYEKFAKFILVKLKDSPVLYTTECGNAAGIVTSSNTSTVRPAPWHMRSPCAVCALPAAHGAQQAAVHASPAVALLVLRTCHGVPEQHTVWVNAATRPFCSQAMTPEEAMLYDVYSDLERPGGAAFLQMQQETAAASEKVVKVGCGCVCLCAAQLLCMHSNQGASRQPDMSS